MLTLLFICNNAYAHIGLMMGQKDVRCVKTQWFDIIYPKESEKTAAVLASNADRIYNEICEEAGLEPSFRLPIVITPNTDVFNAHIP